MPWGARGSKLFLTNVEKGRYQKQCGLEPSTKKKKGPWLRKTKRPKEATNVKLFFNVVGGNGDRLNETNAFLKRWEEKFGD